MAFNINDGIIEMRGFNVGDKILISDADEVTYSDDENGPFKEAEEVKVLLEVETLTEWLDDYDVLEKLGLKVW